MNQRQKPSLREQILQVMEERKITCYRLAQMSNVDEAVILRFVKGERDIMLITASKLTESLGLELRPAMSPKAAIKKSLRSQKRGSLTGRGDSTNDQPKQVQSR